MMTSSLQFAREHDPESHLGECECSAFFSRKAANNFRDYFDKSVAEYFFVDKRWPKEKPINILDIASGNLLQIATIVISLVRAGFLVNLSIMDGAYQDDWKDQSTLFAEKKAADIPLPSKVYVAIAKLHHVFKALNKSVDKENAAQIVGVFSNIDSYLAAVKGLAPLKYETLPLKEIGPRIAAGAKRRYLLPFDAPSYPYTERNERFAREFKEGIEVRGKAPDLVLMIDDITEYYPLVTGRDDSLGKFIMGNRIGGFPEELLDYSYKDEVVEPIKKIKSNAVFLGTHKIYRAKVIEVRKIDEIGNEWIIHGSQNNRAYPILLSTELAVVEEKKVDPSVIRPLEVATFKAEEKETLNVLKNSISTAQREYQAWYQGQASFSFSFWHHHGNQGQQRALQFTNQIALCHTLEQALDLLQLHLNRREGYFKNRGRLYHHSFDTYLLRNIALSNGLVRNLNVPLNLDLNVQTSRENMRDILARRPH